MRMVAAIAAALLAGGCGSASPADAYRADPAALKRGKSIFVGTCAGYCHSTAPINRDAPYLFDCTWRHGNGSDQEIFDLIASGVPDTAMIAFRGKLPEGDDDIWRLVAYITESNSRSCDG